MYCKSSNDFTANEVPKTRKSTLAVLSPAEDKDFIVRKVCIKEGGIMPNHTNKIQHQQYVLRGEGRVIIGENEYHAKAGDFIYIPAGEPHWYEACYGDDYEFLCMITTKEDEIKMLD